MRYTIGIVDEDSDQQEEIRRTIKTNTPVGMEPPEFTAYIDSGDATFSLEEIMKRIKADLSEHHVDGLIIDYKLVRPTANLHGSDIYRQLNDLVPKLPVILLTNHPKSCHDSPYVDADKVYPKDQFFKIEEPFSKEKVKYILENVSKYVSQRAKLQQAFENELNKFKKDSSDFERYSRLVALEDELARFVPQDPSASIGSLNIESLREAVELIDKAYTIMGECDGETV